MADPFTLTLSSPQRSSRKTGKPSTGSVKKTEKTTYPVSDPFVAKARKMMAKYGEPVETLLNIIAVETGGTFQPSAENRFGTAVGLIQFTQDTCEKLGTTYDEMKKRSAIQQLDYVEKYFNMKFNNYLKRSGKKNLGKLRPIDFYAAVFCPFAIGQSPSYVMYDKNKNPGEYQRNKSMDTEKKIGKITLGELYKRFQEHAKKYQKVSK